MGFFQSKISGTANPSSANALRQAYASFLNYVGGDEVGFDDFSEESLRGWIAWMFFNGHTRKTVLYYLKNLSSLYNKGVAESLAAQTDVFSTLRSEILTLDRPVADRIADDEFFEKLRRIVMTDVTHSPDLTLAKDMLLFAIYNGGLTFRELADMKKDGYKGNDESCREIVGRYSRPKNIYLFPLDQSHRTPRQMDDHISRLIASILRTAGLNLGNPAGETAFDLWCMTAMRCGIDPSKVIGCTGRRPVLNPVFAYIHPATVSAEEREQINRTVIDSLTVNPLHWYAMQFRPRVTHDDIMKRFADNQESIKISQTYYPTQEIARRIGRKLVYENRPIIPNIMFFQCRMSAVAPLFRKIGDLAWGYRREMGRGGEYAVISPVEMHRYQLAIGKFTADTQIYPIGTIEVTENDVVEIIGGDFAGRGARIQNVNTDEHKNIIYRLVLLGDNGIEWKVDADARLVRKVSEERYHQLTGNA